MRDWLMGELWYRSITFRRLAIFLGQCAWPTVAHWVFVNTPLGYALRIEALQRGDLAAARRITEILNEAER